MLLKLCIACFTSRCCLLAYTLRWFAYASAFVQVVLQEHDSIEHQPGKAVHVLGKKRRSPCYGIFVGGNDYSTTNGSFQRALRSSNVHVGCLDVFGELSTLLWEALEAMIFYKGYVNTSFGMLVTCRTAKYDASSAQGCFFQRIC